LKNDNYIHYAGTSDEVSALRPAHREYLAQLSAQGKLAASGPMTDLSAALFVYEADSLEAAEQIAADDPYAIGGVLIDAELKEWNLIFSDASLLEVPPQA
jgi:uncharacterized protein YciI